MDMPDAASSAPMNRLLAAHAVEEGLSPSRLDGVRFLRISSPLSRHAVLYPPSIVFTAQGNMYGYLGEERHICDQNHFLMLAIPLPFECEIPDATPEAPFLALCIELNYPLLGRLLLEMDDILPESEAPRGIGTEEITPVMRGTLVRLLNCLGDAMESRILGGNIVRELVYYSLRSKQGRILQAIGGMDGNSRRVLKSLGLIQRDYARELDVETMANEAGMSVSNFYLAFRAVTATSPVQYLKSIRLHKARQLITREGMNVGSAAVSVGYTNSSQFSREYRRFFGNSPIEEAKTRRFRAGKIRASCPTGKDKCRSD